MTIDGTHAPARPPFTVFATQNPIEYEGTYPLPEAQLDRFLLKIRVAYPAREAELEMLAPSRAAASTRASRPGEPVLDARDVAAHARAVDAVHVAPEVREYIASIVRATRDDAGG